MMHRDEVQQADHDANVNGAMIDVTAPRTATIPGAFIHSLPTEILSTIFTLVLPKPYYSSWHYTDLYEIIRVCSRWKEVAEHTPTLWAFVCYKMCTDLLEVSLSRSQNHPLQVNWEFERYTKSSNIARFSIICQHLGRWDTFELAGYPPQEAKPLLTTKGAPQLKSLELRISAFDNSPPSAGDATPLGRDAISLDMFSGNTPALKSLKVSRFPIRWNPTLLSGLLELDIGEPCSSASLPTIAQLGKILSHCSRLESLRFYQSHRLNRRNHSPRGFNVTLPELQTLSLTAEQPAFVHLILKGLHAPNLTTLRISRDIENTVFTNPSVEGSWPFALPYLRNVSGSWPLTVVINEEMGVEEIEHVTDEGTFSIDQLTTRGGTPVLSVRELAMQLERNWGPMSEWKMDRKVLVKPQREPRELDMNALQLIAPKEKIFLMTDSRPSTYTGIYSTVVPHTPNYNYDDMGFCGTAAMSTIETLYYYY